MKRTEVKDLKNKNIKDLTKKVQDLRKTLNETLIEKSLGKLKNTHKPKSIKKEIAQTLTFITQQGFELSKLNTEKKDQKKDK